MPLTLAVILANFVIASDNGINECLRRFSNKIGIELMGLPGAPGKLIQEKHQSKKFSNTLSSSVKT
jgi:hypothetical protein